MPAMLRQSQVPMGVPMRSSLVMPVGMVALWASAVEAFARESPSVVVA